MLLTLLISDTITLHFLHLVIETALLNGLDFAKKFPEFFNEVIQFRRDLLCFRILIGKRPNLLADGLFLLCYGLALKKRIEKNMDKLFTFLDYDGVPWNNNNAEHAVRAFTRLRNVINTSTPKGTREYTTLLSIQQTLRYRGKGFLEFMRSGAMEIDG